MKLRRQAPKFDQSAMNWLLQKLDDDMNTFLSGLPGYILSLLTDPDPELVVEVLMDYKVPKCIAIPDTS